MRWILLLSLLLTGTSWAQSDSTSSVFPDNASLPYPTSLQDRASPQRLESSPQARQERYEASTAKKIALIPGVGFVELGSSDVVRARIVASIVEAYHRFENGGSAE